MMRKINGRGMRRYAAFLAVVVAAALVGGLVAQATAKTPYSVVYSSENPIPQIAADVRPAVVQVINIIKTWYPDAGVRTEDQAFGSGVYFDERGYVVTNYHVIEGADMVDVMLLDGSRLPAQLVGYDDGTDIAVLKVEEKIDARPVPLGDSDTLQIGELAIAIGNPGATDSVLFGTVTAGIISALDRQDVDAGNFTRGISVIQTDAAINTGNSGGALLNAKGELIGIPTLKIMYDSATVYEGLGFAVPINTIRPLLAQIIQTGKVSRPRMGVTVTDFDGPDEALPKHPPAGVQVMEVEMQGPAGRAGVLRYDIITSINGMRVTRYTQLTGEIDSHQAGDIMALEIYRAYDPLTGTLLIAPQTLSVEVALEIAD
jgi:serine protease Do